MKIERIDEWLLDEMLFSDPEYANLQSHDERRERLEWEIEEANDVFFPSDEPTISPISLFCVRMMRLNRRIDALSPDERRAALLNAAKSRAERFFAAKSPQRHSAKPDALTIGHTIEI